ncbi:MAG: redox-sensing transcriptional repressor Rex [Actinomycetota bacterium]|nr:redox-sensing transcriptional repressor Rex [Actinomycetota bacterium]
MKKRIPEGAIERLAQYLDCLMELKKNGHSTVSSKDIGEITDINPAEIRRDLALFGSFGKRGVGYDTDDLIEKIKKIMGSDEQHKIAVIGAGNLGSAIVSYGKFKMHGFLVVAVFDNDPAKIGNKIGGLIVSDLRELKDQVIDKNITVGVIATPPAAAQAIADLLVEAGIKIILNYAPVTVTAPKTVRVHNTSPLKELLYTLYYLSGSGKRKRSKS